jgi:hypothetical protein
MTTRFKNAIDALVHAFFNDTLAAGRCQACAVGNICAWSYGYKKKSVEDIFRIEPGLDSASWGPAVWWGSEGETMEVALNTGYTTKELAKIEQAFEWNTQIKFEMYEWHSKSEITNDQFKGLMAVLDVLCEIEGVEDPQEYKELFAYQL